MIWIKWWYFNYALLFFKLKTLLLFLTSWILILINFFCKIRLRELINHLEHGEIPHSILKKTLQYAACVLDTVTMDETRYVFVFWFFFFQFFPFQTGKNNCIIFVMLEGIKLLEWLILPATHSYDRLRLFIKLIKQI